MAVLVNCFCNEITWFFFFLHSNDREHEGTIYGLLETLFYKTDETSLNE